MKKNRQINRAIEKRASHSKLVVLSFVALSVLSVGMVMDNTAYAQSSPDLEGYLSQIADDESVSQPAQDKLGMGGAKLQIQPSQNQSSETQAAPNDEQLNAPQVEAQAKAEKDLEKPIELNPFEVFGDVVPVQSAAQENTAQQQNVVNDGDALPNIPDLTPRTNAPGMNLPMPNEPLSVSGTGLESSDPRELEEAIRREAFDAAITGLFPLSPENIKILLRRQDEVKRATEEPINGIPTPKINVEAISLDPGVEPMVITTSAGFITTLNILDKTGAPWPIQDVSWAGDFEVIEPEEGGHIIRITPLGKSAYGNMSIRMLTLKTPVTIQLATDKDKVQYRVDARIPEYGPFATVPLIEGAGSGNVAGDAKIMSVLDGVLPDAAQKIKVSGVDGRTSAFKMNNMTYLRTPLTLISPAWEQSVSSADGMNVYALGDAPVVLLSDKGRVTRVDLSSAKEGR